MKLALFILSALLGTAWILGCCFMSAGAIIHILFIASAIALMQGIITTPKAQS